MVQWSRRRQSVFTHILMNLVVLVLVNVQMEDLKHQNGGSINLRCDNNCIAIKPLEKLHLQTLLQQKDIQKNLRTWKLMEDIPEQVFNADESALF